MGKDVRGAELVACTWNKLFSDLATAVRGLNMENPMKVWQIQHDREGSA
jgi:hypothetical protein